MSPVDERAVLDNQAATHENLAHVQRGGAARIRLVGICEGRRDRVRRAVRVHDNQIRVGANRDRPLLRVHAKELRRVRGQAQRELTERPTVPLHQQLEHHGDESSDPSQAFRNRANVVAPRILVRTRKRAVIRGEEFE